MDTPHPAPLTPEQSAAVDDDYIRQKIKEAYADASEHGFEPWDVEELKRKLRERLANNR